MCHALLISNELLGADLHAADKVFFSDDFETLDTWESLFFNGIDQHTTYVIQVQGDSNVLVAKSSGSASAIACKQTFNVTELPIIRWCWKVDNVYAKGNCRIKSGDDYPIRVYYNVIASKFGMVPNYLKSMANSPVALNAYLKLDAMIAGGSFSPVEDIVRLTVSRYNGCSYCVAAHNICIRRRAIPPSRDRKGDNHETILYPIGLGLFRYDFSGFRRRRFGRGEKPPRRQGDDEPAGRNRQAT